MNIEQQRYRRKSRNLYLLLLSAGIFLPLFNVHIVSECLFEKLFLIPCPFCGVRSSIFSFIKGNFQQSLTFNIAGPVIFIVLCFYCIYFTFASKFDYKINFNREVRICRNIDKLLFSLLIFQWLFKLYIGGI